MDSFKKPDLNAPRYRPKKCNLLNIDLYKQFLEKNPKYSHLDLKTFKQVINAFNGAIWETVIDHRDGIELPEQLGHIFLGTCPRKVGENTDYRSSINYGVKTQNKNWESDQYVAKIFYTNFSTKYKFRFHELWGFTGVRDFKRTVAKTYPTEWKKYIVIDNKQQISKLFQKQVYKELKLKETIQNLKDYDEFDLD